jgi:DNA-binding phage protein
MGKKKRAEEPGLIAQLQELIRDSGKTIYQLSKESGLATAQLYRFLSGERTLTLPSVEKICRALRLRLMPVPPEPASRRKAKHKEEE